MYLWIEGWWMNNAGEQIERQRDSQTDKMESLHNHLKSLQINVVLLDLTIWRRYWRERIKELLNYKYSSLQEINFFSFIFISWRLITLQYCSGFCHTLTWISHGFTCVPHPDPPSQLPLHPIPQGLPSALGLSTCLMHPAWAGDLFHPW